MKRRAFVAAAGALLFSPIAALAQSTSVRPLIGVLGGGSPTPAILRTSVDPFREGLRELGYVEGSNMEIEYRWADGNAERLPALARELVRRKVDLLVAIGPAAARAAKDATTTIPVVFTGAGDAVAEGLVASLARPGGNLTGLSISGGVEIVGKRLQLLKEAVPAARKFAILRNPDNPSHAPVAKDLPGYALSLGAEVRMLDARGPDEIDSAFGVLSRERVGGLVVLGDAVFATHAAKLVALSANGRLPTIYGSKLIVEAGGLMSYQGNFPSMYKRSAAFVDKILKGAKPADLAVEQPTKFELAINLKTAKALGLSIPQSLLLQADQVIE